MNIIRRKTVVLLVLLIGMLMPAAGQNAGRGSLFLSGYSELVLGFDTYSRASGAEVFTAVQIGYTFNEDPDASYLGDRSVSPHVEFRIKDVFAGASSGWSQEATTNAFTAKAAFDWARLVFGDYYLKLYGADTDAFKMENVSSFYSVKRKQVERLGTEDHTGSYRNRNFYASENFGMIGAPSGNVFSVGYNNPFIGSFELLINSSDSWKDHSQWGGAEPYLDNRNAYTVGLNGTITAMLDLTLDFQIMGGFGYLVKDGSSASNTIAAGLSGAYKIPLGSGIFLVPRLGADAAFLRDVYPDDPFKVVSVFSDDPANLNFALGGALQVQWPGPYDAASDNLFFGRQIVYSGATVFFNWNPDGNDGTDDMKLGISVWEPSGNEGILPIPMGAAFALEMSNFTKWDSAAKADLMGYVDYTLGQRRNIRPYMGFNYAFRNYENNTMDSSTQFFDSNTLDFEFGVRVSDFVVKSDAFLQYRTGEMLPQSGQERRLGVITAGVVLNF